MYKVLLLFAALATFSGCQNPSLPFVDDEVAKPKTHMVEDRSESPLTENWESRYSP